MRKGIKYVMMFILLLVVAMRGTTMEVSATEISSATAAYETVQTGTMGDNGKVQWSYNKGAKTLTVTGEDSGLSIGYSSPFQSICSDVEKIIIKDFKPIGSAMGLFGGLDKVETIKMYNFDTSNVTDMSYMFYGCNGLTYLSLNSFNTGKVMYMNSMFSGCSGLRTLDVSGFDTSKVTDMSYMFRNCSALNTLDLSSFDTSNVTSMYQMCYDCSGLSTLDLSSFDTSIVTNMNSMFYGCRSLFSLDVSGFDTAKVTDMSYMFYDCYCLDNLDLSSFDTSIALNMNFMFAGCSNLESLDLSSFDTTNVKSMSHMFNCCSNLRSLDLSNFNTGKVTTMDYMFASCSSLTSLNLSSFNTGKVTTMDYMFASCRRLTSLDLSSFNTGNVKSMGSMFYDCSSLTSLDLSSFDTSNVIDMAQMFYDCADLTSLDVSGFSTENVTRTEFMFYNCKSLTSLDVSSFDTGNVTDMWSMFYGCRSLTSLDLSSFDTKSVMDMSSMFYNCCDLTSLDLSSFDTKNVMDMSFMFYNCYDLTNLEVRGFDTGNVTDMSSMFDGCSSLTSLDVSGFDTGKVTSMGSMFEGCRSLTGLDLGSFDMSNVMYSGRMLDDTKAGSIHTPKVIPEGLTISLPVPYVDLQGNEFRLIKHGDENKTLLRRTIGIEGPNELSKGESVQLLVVQDGKLQDVSVNGNYEWKTTNPNVIQISDTGMVTAVDYGTTSVYVSLDDYREQEYFEITVIDKVSLNATEIKNWTIGRTGTFTVYINGEETDPVSMTWSSSDPEVATCEKGYLVGKSVGTTTISCTRENGTTATCIVTVKDAVTLNTSQLKNWSVGRLGWFTAYVNGEAVDGTTMIWSSDNPQVATCVDGELLGVGVGTATISCTKENGTVATCIVTVQEDKVITSQPVNQSVVEGDNAVFNITAEGTDLSYRWQYKSVGTNEWKDSGLSGAKTAALTVGGEMRRNGQQYRCIITDGNGVKVVSNAVTLTVLEKVIITSQPVNQTITQGADAVFKITATGYNLTYQWQYKNAGADKWIDSGMTGARTDSITVPGTAERDGQQYRCIVTDGSGNEIISNEVTMWVETNTEITSQPASVSVAEGADATFAITAKGNNLSYRWQFRTSATGEWKNSGMTGSTTNSIIVQGTTARNGYQYRCVITDARGNKVTSNGATLTVTSKLVITSQPTSQRVIEGSNATFKVTATGGNLKYQWQFRTSSAGTWKNSGMAGATTNSITVQGTTARNGYQYRCVITDGNGNKVTSNGATLTVTSKLAIIGQPASQNVIEGANAVFKVTATGSGLKYQWQFRTSAAGEWKNSGMTGTTTNSITVQGTKARNGYQYRCVITDASGDKVTSNGATLTVVPKLAITGQPANQNVTEGSNAVFKVTATGSGLKYQWQFRTSASGTWKNSGMTGATTNTITVQGTTARNGYQYRCVITDGTGTKVTSNGAILTVK